MRSQLYRLAEVAEHPKTTIQVIRSGDAHAGLLAHFVIADLDGKPSVVYLETAAEGHITDSSSVVDHVALSFDRIRAGAESWAASRDLIRKVAERGRNLAAMIAITLTREVATFSRGTRARLAGDCTLLYNDVQFLS